MQSVLTIRLDSAVKEKATKVMKREGLTPSQAVRRLFDYTSINDNLPVFMTEKPSDDEITRRLKAFDLCHTKKPLTLSDDDIHALRLKERYEFDA